MGDMESIPDFRIRADLLHISPGDFATQAMACGPVCLRLEGLRDCAPEPQDMHTSLIAPLLAAATLLGLPLAAVAACSRVIDVPLAPVGLSVAFDGMRAVGVYPDLLKELAASGGCRFNAYPVPRARLQKMFEGGQADLLLPATAVSTREAFGDFVPLLQVRPALMSIGRDAALPRSLAELLATPGLRLVVVRGFSFGEAYDGLLAQLRAQQRVVEETDAAGVAKALRMGLGEVSVMAPSIMIGALVQSPSTAAWLKELRLGFVEELGWNEIGVYLSRQSLAEADRQQLRQAFAHAGRTRRAYQLFIERHPPGSLGDSVRPLPP
jgi:polar amino acid transport system substrate-binding protein